MMRRMADAADWFVLVNPASGGGQARRRWPALQSALRRQGIGFERADTSAPGDGTRLAADALQRGHRRLLAIGGDGTFNELLNGVFPESGVPPRDCLLAAAPFGTGNDWAHTMQVPADPERLAGCLARGRARSADLGVVTSADGRRLAFHTVAGAGLDAAVLARTSPRGPRALAYLLALLRTIREFRASQFRLTVDGAPAEGRWWLAQVANGPRCGGGMRLAPGALPDDGLLDLVTVAPLGLRQSLARLPKLFDGRLDGDPAFPVTRCRQVTIHADPPVEVEVDGQRFGTTPVAVHVLSGALRALDCRPDEPSAER